MIIVFQLGEDGEAGDGVIDEAESEEVKRAKLLEVEAVRVAEGGSLGDALELLNQAITVAPNYASPYNNRAQVRGGRETEREGGGEGEREREGEGGRGRETHTLREGGMERGESLVPSPVLQCLYYSNWLLKVLNRHRLT